MGAGIWVFCSEDDMTRTKSARTFLRKKIRERNWALQERPTRSVRTPGGGLLHVANPRDVIALYRDAHRSSVALLVSGEIRFCTEPPEDRAVRRDLTLRLLRHCQYKAYCCNFPETSDDLETFIAGFDDWTNTIHCDGDTDARCLPFPVFKPKTDFDNLADSDFRARFDAAHHHKGRVGGKADERGLVWETDPRAFHGHETLTVAGRALSKGFHWDVQNDEKKPKTFGSPTEVWEIRSRSYLNVYPDGKIIGRPPNARKIVG